MNTKNTRLKPWREVPLVSAEFIQKLFDDVGDRFKEQCDEIDGVCEIWFKPPTAPTYGMAGSTYGRIHVSKRYVKSEGYVDCSFGVHQLVYRYFNGPIPEGGRITHICPMMRCINPKHMRLIEKTGMVTCGSKEV